VTKRTIGARIALALTALAMVGGCEGLLGVDNLQIVQPVDAGEAAADQTAADGPGDATAEAEDVTPRVDGAAPTDSGGATTCPPYLVMCAGTCIDPNNDPAHCGATHGCGVDGGSAGKACTDAYCAGGVCESLDAGVSCPSYLVSCAGTCVDPTNNPAHCGATQGCGVDGGSAGVACNAGYCTGGACQAGDAALACPPYLISCGGLCIDPLTNPSHCGATAGCGADAGSAGTACSAGSCVNASCQCLGGQTGCGGGDAGPALCTNLKTDNSNCGSCGNVCAPAQACDDGACVFSCPSGLVNCSGRCIDPATSNQFCGASGGCGADGGSAGTACGSGLTCSAGACTLICPTGLVSCGGKCVDPTSNSQYCGATAGCGAGGMGSAGTSCGSGAACVSGNCTSLGGTCPTGQILCGGACTNPATSISYCGATGNCMGVNAGAQCGAGEVCSAAQCQLTCQAGLLNCFGACIDPLSNLSFCGAGGNCGTGQQGQDCNTLGGGHVCVAGTCTLSCQSGLVNCSGTCTNPQTDNLHCGAGANCSPAGTACPSGKGCHSGTCS
jgi:hypothetical protein